MNARAFDNGVARERTSLAWRRTALAFAVNALLLLHSANVAISIAALTALALACGVAAASALTFRNPQTRGWFAGRLRAELLVGIATIFGVLDLIAITR
jgi:uncharacterized membrane protein YidH (DUF202 family)